MHIGYVKRIIKKLIHKTEDKILNNVNKTDYDKNCLLSYITQPFIEGPNADHQNQDQVIEIARLIGNRGYNVDVIDFYAKKVNFDKKYDALFEIHVRDNPVYKGYLKEDAVRIMYITGSNPRFANEQEKIRLSNLEMRRGKRLIPRRQATSFSDEIENFDEVIIIGNQVTYQSYAEYSFKKVAFVNNTGYDFDFGFNKQLKKSNAFLFFGSCGSVHKGLDLLLEVFSEKDFPCELYVCGGYLYEKDFYKAYKKELTKCDNIKACGFVNVNSDEFKALCDKCSFTILPSCAEGMAGTITTCMSAGVIPVCSRECGVDEDDVIVLEDCTIETIREKVLELANMDIDKIEELSRKSIDLYHEKYNMNAFSRMMNKAISEVL